MSLSFVSKSVQTSTEGGGFEETPIAGAEETTVTTTSKPLFEQLRANQEQEEAERAESQMAMMRGTLALDEEDAEHLNSLRRKAQEERDEVKRQTEEELAAFRTARADRSSEASSHHLQRKTESLIAPPMEEPLTTKPVPKIAAPQIRFKKKRRKNDAEVSNGDAGKKTNSTEGDATSGGATGSKPGLGSLLSGYGSSSDDED
jgi:hypothetical protein